LRINENIKDGCPDRQYPAQPRPKGQVGHNKKGTVPMEKLFALFVAISITTLQFAATVA
jgi:hypothetical protein